MKLVILIIGGNKYEKILWCQFTITFVFWSHIDNDNIFLELVVKNNTITLRRNIVHIISPWMKSTLYLGCKSNKMIYCKLCCLREEMVLDTTETIYKSWHEKPQRFFTWSSLFHYIHLLHQWHEISETNKSYLCIFLLLCPIFNKFAKAKLFI